MSDLIDRQAAIDALNEYFERIGKLKRRGLTKGEKAISLDTVGAIKTLPPAQFAPDQNGDLWITVPDIDEVTCIYVQESKSKFCRIFYEGQEQPERIKGHWIKISPANIYECSECGKNVMTNDICAYDFCHGCGAEMEVAI